MSDQAKATAGSDGVAEMLRRAATAEKPVWERYGFDETTPEPVDGYVLHASSSSSVDSE